MVARFVLGGDEYQTPKLREGTDYASAKPEYRMIGAQELGTHLRFWVVAHPTVVLTQRGVNAIISDIRRRTRASMREGRSAEIFFYSAVTDIPKFPSFRITDHLAAYNPADNKTYFGPASKLYGSWVHGPRP
ncbi:MAG: hypothetical protein EHM23_28715 [Acidobacteria bacterium]|nr:MAG: hypothetical protein EHM23_28715 [Acidobacteriota bacterium]